jgi:hypothetical protein
MALIDLDTLAQNTDFKKKVKVAMVYAATNVSAETVDQNYLPYHNKRIDLSKNILNGPQNYVEPFSYACAARQTLTENSTDGDIQFTVNSLFDAMAGVRQDEKPN